MGGVAFHSFAWPTFDEKGNAHCLDGLIIVSGQMYWSYVVAAGPPITAISGTMWYRKFCYGIGLRMSVRSSSTRRAMRALVVGVPFRHGWVIAIVFVIVFASGIWLALKFRVHLETSMAKLDIILVRCVPTAMLSCMIVPRFSNAIANALGLRPTTQVRIAISIL